MKFNELNVRKLLRRVENIVIKRVDFKTAEKRIRKILSNNYIVDEMSLAEADILASKGYDEDINEMYTKEFVNAVKLLLTKPERDPDRGLFICFTGIDKCGKATQVYGSKKYNIPSISSYFEEMHKEVLIIEQPTYDTLLGLIVGAGLGTPKTPVPVEKTNIKRYKYLTYALDRVQHNPEIIEVLNRNGYIIANRWKESNFAFQPIFSKKPMEFYIKMEENVVEPDIIFYMHITPEESMKRLRKEGIKPDEHEKLSIQKKVYKNYEELCKKENWIKIDGMKKPAEVGKEVITVLKGKFSSFS